MCGNLQLILCLVLNVVVVVVMVVAVNPLLPHNVVKLEGPSPCDTVKHSAISFKIYISGQKRPC